MIKALQGAKWHLWHGCPYPALRRLENLSWDLDAEASPEEAKLLGKLEELIIYLDNNRGFIVNYGDRYRDGEPIASGFVESAVNQVISKRFVKRQQMAWRPRHAHALLQIRTAVLNDQLRSHVERWYPSVIGEETTAFPLNQPPFWRGLHRGCFPFRCTHAPDARTHSLVVSSETSRQGAGSRDGEMNWTASGTLVRGKDWMAQARVRCRSLALRAITSGAPTGGTAFVRPQMDESGRN